MKKFLTSVADVYAYDNNDVLLFQAKTLLDSSIEVTLGNSDVRGGRGNQLQFVYYNSAEMNITITDAQWNLSFVSQTVGQDIETGNNVYTEEDVTLGVAGAGTVAGTPLAIQGTTIYGWIKHVGNDTPERVVFTGQNFTSTEGSQGDKVCIRYFAVDNASRSVKIPANFVPAVVRLVLETQLNSSDSSANVIGKTQILIPKATLSGAFSIAMTPDGVASTPLSARALASDALATGACSDEPIYAQITEILDNINWYDDVIALAIEGGDFDLDSGGSKQLTIYAIKNNGDAAFQPPIADITFADGNSGTFATVSATGLVEHVSAGTTTISATITAKPSVDANVIVTCNA